MVKEETTNNTPSTSLSLYFDHPTNPKNHKPNLEGIFECKTCNKQFSSFQALGGHRTSHNRRTIRAPGLDAKTKNRAHECSVCGMEFSIGQALGGHMRRHRTTISSTIPSPAEFELLDLSCPSRGNMHLLDLFPDH